jgi:fluoride exporter
MIGSLLRYVVSLVTSNVWYDGFPYGTLIVNLIGSLFLGWFTSNIIASKKLNPVLATAIGTGITGSFTTFSTFSLESLTLLQSGNIGPALLYMLGSAIGGLLLTAAGFYFGLDKNRHKEADK